MIYFQMKSELCVIMLLHALNLLTTHLLRLIPNGTKYRIIPSSVFGAAALLHFFSSAILHGSYEYPTLAFLARLPEFLALLIIMSCVVVYFLAWILREGITDQLRHILDADTMPVASDDFSIALFKCLLTLLIAVKPFAHGFAAEQSPAIVPLDTYVDQAAHRRRQQRAEILATPKQRPPPKAITSPFSLEQRGAVRAVYMDPFSMPDSAGNYEAHSIDAVSLPALIWTCVHNCADILRSVFQGTSRRLRRKTSSRNRDYTQTNAATYQTANSRRGRGSLSDTRRGSHASSRSLDPQRLYRDFLTRTIESDDDSDDDTTYVGDQTSSTGENDDTDLTDSSESDSTRRHRQRRGPVTRVSNFPNYRRSL